MFYFFIDGHNDQQAADGGAVGTGREDQAVGVQAVAVEHDGRFVAVGGKAVVGGCVEYHRPGDGWQSRCQCDGVSSGTGDVEVDVIRYTALALASMIACRSDPAPVLLVLVTV